MTQQQKGAPSLFEAFARLSKTLGNPKEVETLEGECVEAALLRLACEKITASAAATAPAGGVTPTAAEVVDYCARHGVSPAKAKEALASAARAAEPELLGHIMRHGGPHAEWSFVPSDAAWKLPTSEEAVARQVEVYAPVMLAASPTTGTSQAEGTS